MTPATTMAFQRTQFSKWDELTLLEKFVLRTCCYFPMRPPGGAVLGQTAVSDSTKLLIRAFGERFAGEVKGQRVLDFGCGAGAFALGLAMLGAAEATGIDIQDGFGDAKAEAARLGMKEKVRFVLGPSSQLESAAFDSVIFARRF